LVHHVVGEERDRPEHLTSHIFRRWSVFARSFSSRKRATRCWPAAQAAECGEMVNAYGVSDMVVL